MGPHFTIVSDSTVFNGLGAGHSLTSGRTPIRPFGWGSGIKKFVRRHQEYRTHSSEEILQGCSRRAAVSFRQITSDIRPTEVATCTDAGGGGGL